ncbi:MAG TPA: VOC family protein [Thermoplasmata archaeon]|nr:VOC family protein [Thermoplasmata archaeon]
MLDHVILPVPNVSRSVAFYEAALAPLGVLQRADFEGRDGPKGHPDLKGFGFSGRYFLWLREGRSQADHLRLGITAADRAAVDAAFAVAIQAGATVETPPGVRGYYDPRYYAANVFDPDGYSLEFVHKSWQHPAIDR